MRLTGMFVIVTLIVVISVVLPTLSARTFLAAVQSKGRLEGMVLDANGAAIVTQAPIIIEGERTTQKVVVDENGGYKVELPAGTYRIRAELPGFYPFRRAAFRVRPGATIMINIVPTLRYLARGTTVSPSESIDVVAPRPKYDLLQLAPSPGAPSAFVQFRKKNTRRGIVEYDGATLSYDVLTIHADQVRYHRRARRLEASGERVIVENGKERVAVKGAGVEFKSGEPVINLTR